MNLKTSKVTKPTDLQKAFAQPYDASSEAEFKGLMFVEELLKLMKKEGVNRTQLAKRMGVQPSRITAMLNGTSNFTLETLIRASRAVGATLEQALCPRDMKCKWVFYRESETHEAFSHLIRANKKASSNFVISRGGLAKDDDAKAA